MNMYLFTVSFSVRYPSLTVSGSVLIYAQKVRVKKLPVNKYN